MEPADLKKFLVELDKKSKEVKSEEKVLKKIDATIKDMTGVEKGVKKLKD